MTAPAPRADLLALTPEALAALANRGLVKRAAKDLDAGTVPELTTGDDASVRAVFPDGTAAVLPAGTGLDDGRCDCAATGVCRHLIALVLAYRRLAADAPSPAPRPPVEWSPGTIDDDTLTGALGARPVAAARRTLRRGYEAVVHRPTAGRPEPWVELPACTVRFPVPGEIGYATTDATTALRAEVVALAVWAFRAADAEAAEPAERSATVRVGGERVAEAGAPGRTTTQAPPPAESPAPPRAPSGGAGSLDVAGALVEELLLDGVAQAGPVLAGAVDRAGRALARDAYHWPGAALAELAGQLTAYADRGAAHRPELVAALLTEVHARRLAAAVPGVLGTDEAAETPLRQVRLTALGCRITGPAETPVAEVYFAHPHAGTVLVLRREWPQRLTGHALARRRLLSTTLGALATGTLVSESVRRTAGRTLTIARGRLGATGVTPVGSSWTRLPPPLLVGDLAALIASWDGRPPRLIRPRVAAGAVRVVALCRIEDIGYDAGEQRLEAVVRDAAGNRALLASEYRPGCPGALDALADALRQGATHVSGAVVREGGGIRIDPIAVLTPGGVTVPDLAPGDGAAALAPVARRAADPLTAALEEAVAALAALAHGGLRSPSGPVLARIGDAATALRRTGLGRAAALLRTVLAPAADAAGADGPGRSAAADGSARVAAWLEAQLHLLVTGELLAAEGSGAGAGPDGHHPVHPARLP
ncbi:MULTISPECIES: hypothetical protein [unclassified Streptomyces]|uniref:hypothetical protein n=1 Tax=unclassified Streptomyces TaxID=2593676 RepID=UPI001F543D30|nr:MULTISPECIES: hypothetical protein [unclassified Streptomyces]